MTVRCFFLGEDESGDAVIEPPMGPSRPPLLACCTSHGRQDI